jgi:actin related protein 2/3 complex subunit 2
MIILERGNRILEEVVASVILRDEDSKQEMLEVKLCDFDDAMYFVKVAADNTNEMLVSMSMPGYHYAQDFGAKEALEKHFGDMVTTPEGNNDCTLKIDLTKLPEKEEDKKALVDKIATMKGRIMGGLFQYYFQGLADKAPKKAEKFKIRSDTTIYMCPSDDRVVVVYELDFSEDVDKVIAKIMMSEFPGIKKNYRGLDQSPPCHFSETPPSELDQFNVREGNALGYISFAVLPGHVKDAVKIENITHVLVTFRSFLQYHIKMSKSYFHSRMRKRSADLLKVLNRAKVEDPNEVKNKKTAAGKTFKR